METNNTVQVNVDQDSWVVQIKHGLNIQEDDEEEEFCISVFNVPRELLAVKPEAYIPQSVSIGPYHHWRSELNEMERYKLASARRFQKRISCHKFESVVEEVRKYDWKIRRCYHKYLDCNEEALSWLMALDASFVLECLQFYVKKADESPSDVSHEVKQMAHVLDPNGRSATHNAIIRDLMKLENQIPLFVLEKLLEMQLGSADQAEKRLRNLIRLTCVELSPFKFKLPEESKLRTKERGHILEVLYYSLVPPATQDDLNVSPKGEENEQQPSPDTTYITRASNQLWKILSSLNVGPIRHLTALLTSLWRGRAVQVLMKLPLLLLSTLGNLPILRGLKGPLTFIFGSSTDTNKTDANEEESSVEIPPTRDELDIPSVGDLYSAGIKFLPTDGDLTSIRFDQKTATLYLPQVKLDANTEVILRNLVAFEASAAPGALMFTRYADFMNGIIDTEEDVKLLRSSGIIFNHLENDGKVASLWNGMGKCVKMCKVRMLDQVITDINKHYNRRWSVAAMEYVNNYIFGSWQVLSLLAVAIFLLMTCLQAFCSVYNCKKWFNDTNLFAE